MIAIAPVNFASTKNVWSAMATAMGVMIQVNVVILQTHVSTHQIFGAKVAPAIVFVCPKE